MVSWQEHVPQATLPCLSLEVIHGSWVGEKWPLSAFA